MRGCSASAFFTARACARALAQLHAPRLCEQIVDPFRCALRCQEAFTSFGSSSACHTLQRMQTPILPPEEVYNETLTRDRHINDCTLRLSRANTVKLIFLSTNFYLAAAGASPDSGKGGTPRK